MGKKEKLIAKLVLYKIRFRGVKFSVIFERGDKDEGDLTKRMVVLSLRLLCG